jgi:hypothetical protein
MRRTQREVVLAINPAPEPTLWYRFSHLKWLQSRSEGGQSGLGWQNDTLPPIVFSVDRVPTAYRPSQVLHLAEVFLFLNRSRPTQTVVSATRLCYDHARGVTDVCVENSRARSTGGRE